MTVQDFAIHAFSPWGFRLWAKTKYGRLVASRPGPILQATGAVAVIDGPMWLSGGVAQATYVDKERDINIRGTLGPGHGCFLNVLNGVASMGDELPGADVSVQLYPCLVQNGANVHSHGIDEGSTWRVAAGVLRDGRVAFAIGRSGLTEFSDRLITEGFIDAGYTDGGHSSVLAKSDGTIVQHSNLVPVDSYLIDTGATDRAGSKRTSIAKADASGTVAAVAVATVAVGTVVGGLLLLWYRSRRR